MTHALLAGIITSFIFLVLFVDENEKIEIVNPVESVPVVEETTPPEEPATPELQEDSVEIDLDAMTLTIWKDGAPETFPVLSKGDPERTNETPRGEFEALYKAEKHFSSIGHVWMPFSIQFKGNFFIHGWPYYPDGRDVAKGYSGGCVRLSTEDAQRVYEFVKIGTPIHIR